jgi:hypothetical protein
MILRRRYTANCAVVLSETSDYDLAVREMKRYLLLAPSAPDAHAAQNNIYKWERKASGGFRIARMPI